MSSIFRSIKKKPVELTESDLRKILKGKTNPLWKILCNGYGTHCSNLELLTEFCNKYIKNTPEPNTLTIEILVNETSHCGYCSDNDGKISNSVSTIYYYLLLPQNYTINNIPALYKSFDVPTCYCGGNSFEYKIVKIY